MRKTWRTRSILPQRAVIQTEHLFLAYSILSIVSRVAGNFVSIKLSIFLDILEEVGNLEIGSAFMLASCYSERRLNRDLTNFQVSSTIFPLLLKWIVEAHCNASTISFSFKAQWIPPENFTPCKGNLFFLQNPSMSRI